MKLMLVLLLRLFIKNNGLVFKSSPNEINNMTNTAGVLNTVLTVPSYVEKVFVSGFMNSMELGIVDDAVQYTFGANSRSMQGTFTL